MLFTLSGILFSLSTLGTLILHGVLKIYDAKGDLAEKMKKYLWTLFPRYFPILSRAFSINKNLRCSGEKNLSFYGLWNVNWEFWARQEWNQNY